MNNFLFNFFLLLLRRNKNGYYFCINYGKIMWSEKLTFFFLFFFFVYVARQIKRNKIVRVKLGVKPRRTKKKKLRKEMKVVELL